MAKAPEMASLVQMGLYNHADAYESVMGRRPPENKFSETEWPTGPVKAKRLALKMEEEKSGNPGNG